MMIDWDIGTRYDLSGLPLQFLVRYKRDGDLREVVVHLLPEPYKDVPSWLGSMRGVLDGIESAYRRDREHDLGWAWG